MDALPLFREPRPDALHDLIRRYPLGTLCTCDAEGRPQADLMPMELVLPEAPGEALRLRGHVGRHHAVARAREGEVLAVFQSPGHFIDPRWYVAGRASRRNAPSWNYAAVQARGAWRRVDDAGWMHRHLAALTAAQAGMADGPAAWSPDDVDPAVLAAAVARLVGWELTVQALEGKFFLSQQRTPADRVALAAGLRATGRGAALELAALIEAGSAALSQP